MDDIQKRADDKAWDEKQDRWISDANRKIEHGLRSEALAALHELHAPANEEPSYDADETSDVHAQEILRDKIIGRLIQIGATTPRKRDLSDDVNQNATTRIHECYPS